MSIEWNNKNNRFDSNGGNGRESFRDHNERMRSFRRSHAGNLKVRTRGSETFEEHTTSMRMFRESHPSDLEMKVSRRDLIDKMWPLLVTDTLKETGGSRLLKDTLDWSTLIPIQKVTACRFSLN